MDEIFVSINDISKSILSYIRSENFEQAVNLINDTGRSGFMSGLAMAVCIIMADCPKYLKEVKE